MIQKLLIAIIALVLVLHPLTAPKTAYAQIPTTDFASIINDIWIGIVRPVLLQTLKKRLLDVMVDQIVAWIQGGPNAKPKFVTDWKGFLEDAGQSAAGDFVQELGAGFLCKPFKIQVQLGVLAGVTKLPVTKFSSRATCTLDKIVKNVESFKRDFRNGGWLAYQASFQPNNNFYGSFLISLQEAETRKSAAQFAASTEAQSGGGFLGAKKCRTDVRTRQQICEIVTPGSSVQQVTNRAITSDIDFLLSSEDLSAYGAAIASAAINRVINEGIKEFKERTDEGDSNEASALIDQIATGSFVQSQSSTITEINQSLNPRQEAQSFLTTAIDQWKQYRSSLISIKDIKLNTVKSSCSDTGITPPLPSSITVVGGLVSKAKVTDFVSAEIAGANNVIADLENEKLDNQVIISQLASAQSQIQALTSSADNLIKISEIRSDIENNLDSGAASTINSDASASADNITASLQSGDKKTLIDSLNSYATLCKE